MLKDISVDFDHNKLIIYVRKYGIGQYVTKYNEQINTVDFDHEKLIIYTRKIVQVNTS